MIYSQVKQGSVGVNVNHDFSCILLAVTDSDGESARVSMTEEQAEQLIKTLQEKIIVVKSRKSGSK